MEYNQSIYIKCEQESQKSSQSIVATSTKKPQFYPSGWWPIALSKEVPEQAEISMRYFGRDLIFSRFGNGTLRIRENNQNWVFCEQDRWIWIKWGQVNAKVTDYLSRFDQYYFNVLISFSNTSFALNMENQIDNTHVEIVHAESFWFLAKLVMEGIKPSYQFTKEGIFWCFEAPQFYWQVIFPNIWISSNDDNYVLVVIFVPADESQTKVYVMSYRNFLTNPIVNAWFDHFIYQMNTKIRSEDETILRAQQKNGAGFKTHRLFRHDDQGVRFFGEYMNGEKSFLGHLNDAAFVKLVDTLFCKFRQLKIA